MRLNKIIKKISIDRKENPTLGNLGIIGFLMEYFYFQLSYNRSWLSGTHCKKKEMVGMINFIGHIFKEIR